MRLSDKAIKMTAIKLQISYVDFTHVAIRTKFVSLGKMQDIFYIFYRASNTLVAVDVGGGLWVWVCTVYGQTNTLGPFPTENIGSHKTFLTENEENTVNISFLFSPRI